MKGVASMVNITNLFGGKAKAAEVPYDYGFDIYSFGIDTLEDPRYEIPQENSKLALELLNGPSGGDYIKRSKECFGIKIDGQGNVKSEGQAPSYSSIKKSGSSCDDPSEDWTRIRFHIFDNQTAGAALCYEGEDCTDFGFDEEASTSTTGSISSGTYTAGGELSCDGYFKVSPQPAIVTDGRPAGSLVPYSAEVQQSCESLKQSCLSGVSGGVKALCAAFEFHDAFYGSTSLPDRNMAVYGMRAATNGLHDPEGWYSKRQPGLNPYNMLECSALTMVAVWRAFGNTQEIGCSGSWGSRSHPDLFRQVAVNEIQPGDFLSKNFGCNVASTNQTTANGGHVAIAASTVSADGKVLVYEQSGYGTTTHFRLANMSSFAGNHSRWIGPGL